MYIIHIRTHIKCISLSKYRKIVKRKIKWREGKPLRIINILYKQHTYRTTELNRATTMA